jgi:hypothetical protein
MAECWKTWAHRHNRARTLGHVTGIRCRACGGEIWADENKGWRWCRNLDCKVGTVRGDGTEFIKAEYLPMSNASR